MRKLLDNPEQWSKQIQTAFYEEYPFFVQYPISVNLIRKDLKKGFAVGTITVTDTFSVPVIIDNFLLKDFDVAMYNGNAIPLTQESITDLFSNPNAFMVSGENMQDSKINRLFTPDLTYPSDYGDNTRTGVRYTKTAMLKNLLPYVTKENQEKVASIFDPRDLASFKKNGTDHLLKDFFEAVPRENLNLEKIAEDNLSQDYTFLYKVARDHYRAYFMNAEVDHRQVLDINEDEYLTLNMKLAEKKEVPVVTEPKLLLKTAEVRPGIEGLISDGTTHIKLAVTNVLTSDGNMSIEGLGKHLSHITCDVAHVNKIEKVAENKYLLPKDFKFFELGLEGGDKVAVDTSNRVIRDSITGHFTFQGPIFDKYAERHKMYNLPAEEAFVNAVHCGVCAEDLAKMANLRRDTPFYFENSELKCPIPMAEFVQKLAEVTERDKIDIKIIEHNIEPVIKLASKLEEDYVVDKVLALGTLNDRSIKEFINYIPQLEETASYLARLLMLIRIGQKGISESDVEEAMEALSRIILHLKNVAQTNKNIKDLKS